MTACLCVKEDETMTQLARIKAHQQRQAAIQKAQQDKQAALQTAIQAAFRKAWDSDHCCTDYRRLLASGREKGYNHARLRVFAVNALAAATNGLAARSWPLLDMADKFLAEREKAKNNG